VQLMESGPSTTLPHANCGVATPTSTTASAGTFALCAAAKIASATAPR